MASILAFAGSNSSTSINFELVRCTVALGEGHTVQFKDMAQYSFPMYRADDERSKGHPPEIVEFAADVRTAEGLILSVNEHNGNPSAYFKNLMDWLSRLDRKFMEGTKVLLMSTSGGKRGGMGSQEVTAKLLPRFGGEVVSSFSLPSFRDNFGNGEILDPDLKAEHQKAVRDFLETLTQH